MPRPPAPDEVCERAWELYATARGWREVGRLLTKELKRPVSHETARQWGMRGKKLYMTKKDIDPLLQRYRFADFLEQWMGRLSGYADEGAELKDVLEITAQLKWMYEARAKLVAINAEPPRGGSQGEPVEPQAFIQDMVRRGAPDPEELYGGGNGRR